MTCAIVAPLPVETACGASFVVDDRDFVDGVYEFHYFAQGDKLSVNGLEIVNPALTLTNTGWRRDGFDYTRPDQSTRVQYWQANGPSAPPSGEMTMGWDFRRVSHPIGKVELVTGNMLFQFDPFALHAFKDRVFGEVSTPAAFGAGPYTNIYTLVGNGDASIGAIGAMGQTGSAPGPIFEITSLLSPAWLEDPGLLELRFGYKQHPIDAEHPSVPGRHIQLFRDYTGAGNEGFLLRVTLASEPSANTVKAHGDGLLIRAIAPGVGVNFDGRPVLRNRILVPPGEYDIRLGVRLDDADPRRRQLEIRGGGITHVELSPKPPRAAGTDDARGGLSGRPAVVGVFNLAPAPLAVTPSQEDPKGRGWKEFPGWLEGAVVYSQPTGAGPGAVADVRVLQGGVVYVACHYGYEGNASGGWQKERLTEEQMIERGWTVVGEMVRNNNRKCVLFGKWVEGDTRILLRCNKYDPPWVIVSGKRG
jgi:hypothetical protein